ncbi:30S ribosomal protein S15 [Mycoplasmopsis californica]|uniref:Small ribosomal subunit protein uS15 n=1 Tax=Mycoplasmopsis equigenitalium TaxID=114883 RepID=A0ABY5J3N4_9BACT|nr:30S ribosomal protein S15 [Mycoplasmopsis equigenitalium]UUD37136.1 30S ribosomal protein S15 [Mycoplasmopsis equigenitalium]VEU69557.1 30S ribosomal protein S15 [Mycoplasmopsis californica]
MLTKDTKAKLVQKFGKDKKNTGAIEVQIALLTQDIETLKPHFQANPKDNHSKRGFMAKINKRKSLLAYLKRTNYDSYAKLIAELGIRK